MEIILIIWLLLVIGSVWLADQKGRSKLGWGLAVTFFGIFAFIFLAFAPGKR